MAKTKKHKQILENNWNTKNELECKMIGEKASAFSWLHIETASSYEFKNKIFNLIIMIGSYLFGTTGVSTILSSNENMKYVNFIISILVLCLGVISTINKILDYPKKISQQKWGANRNSTLFILVKRELNKPRNKRQDFFNFYKNITNFQLKLQKNAPDIPGVIVKKYYSKFGKNAMKYSQLFGFTKIKIQNNLKKKNSLILIKKHKKKETPSKNNFKTIRGNNRLTKQQQYQLTKYLVNIGNI